MSKLVFIINPKMNYRAAALGPDILKPTDLENTVPVCIQRGLSQLDDEHAVGATGLSVQAGVCDLPLLLACNSVENLKVIHSYFPTAYYLILNTELQLINLTL